MQTPRSQFALKLLPSLTDFAFLMPLVFLFGRLGGAKMLLSDCDTGWHIRTGEWILAHHAVPVHDMFSFSKPGGPWYAWEWLAEVLWAWLNGLGGLAAVVLVSVLLISVTFTLLFRLVRRRSSPVVAIGVTMVAAAASSLHWLARPHLFTLLFVVLFCAALEQVRDGHRRLAGVPYLAILPVATVLWTNLHAGFFVGVLLVAAYGGGDLLQAAFATGGDQRRRSWRTARGYLLSAAACLAASFVNPYSYRLHVHIWKYLDDPYPGQHISEFLSISFHEPLALFFEAMLLAGAAAAFWYASKGSFTEPLLLLIWGHAALLAGRNIPIFVIVAAVPVAAALQAGLTRLPQFAVAEWLRTSARRFNAAVAEMAETDAIGRWHLASVAGAAMVAALLYAPAPPKRFRCEFDPNSYPAGAIQVLRSDPSARIFTHDEWGDYLIYRLYPFNRVFVDGRSDYYGTDFENKYLEVMKVRYGWEQILGRFGVNTILLPPSVPLAGALKESSRWRVVYDDGVALVFRPAQQAVGEPYSAAARGGPGRDRKVAKTENKPQT